MPWKRVKHRTWRLEAMLVGAAILLGILSCAIGGRLGPHYRSLSQKYSDYSTLMNRYSDKDIDAMKIKYADRLNK